jgi:uncharacterized membrane protein YhaH (DUF805 family)
MNKEYLWWAIPYAVFLIFYTLVKLLLGADLTEAANWVLPVILLGLFCFIVAVKLTLDRLDW